MHATVCKSGSSVSLMVLHLPPRRHARHSASSVSGPPECPLGAGAGAGDAVPRLRQQQQSPTTFHCHCPVCKCISVFASFSMHGIIRNSFHALEIRQLLHRPSHCLSLKNMTTNRPPIFGNFLSHEDTPVNVTDDSDQADRSLMGRLARQGPSKCCRHAPCPGSEWISALHLITFLNRISC